MELKNPDKRIFFELEYEKVFVEAISALGDCGFEVGGMTCLITCRPCDDRSFTCAPLC